MSERTIPHIPEKEFYDSPVFSGQSGFVSVSMVDDGEVRTYTVGGDTHADRARIDSTFRALMDVSGSNWQETQGGLRDVGLTIGRVRRLARSARLVDQMTAVAGPATELVDILKRNARGYVTEADIPVYNYAASVISADDELAKKSPRSLWRLLIDSGLDNEQAQKFLPYMGAYSSPTPFSPAPFGDDEFYAALGNTVDLENQVLRNALLGELDAITLKHLVEKIRDHTFTGFPVYDPKTGAPSRQWDDKLFVRTDDIPEEVPPSHTSLSVHPSRLWRPRSPHHQLARFHTHQDAHYARPEVSWRVSTDQNGEERRELVFPRHRLDYEHITSSDARIVRPNSLVGAALCGRKEPSTLRYLLEQECGD